MNLGSYSRRLIVAVENPNGEGEIFYPKIDLNRNPWDLEILILEQFVNAGFRIQSNSSPTST